MHKDGLCNDYIFLVIVLMVSGIACMDVGKGCQPERKLCWSARAGIGYYFYK